MLPKRRDLNDRSNRNCKVLIIHTVWCDTMLVNRCTPTVQTCSTDAQIWFLDKLCYFICGYIVFCYCCWPILTNITAISFGAECEGTAKSTLVTIPQVSPKTNAIYHRHSHTAIVFIIGYCPTWCSIWKILLLSHSLGQIFPLSVCHIQHCTATGIMHCLFVARWISSFSLSVISFKSK